MGPFVFENSVVPCGGSSPSFTIFVDDDGLGYLLIASGYEVNSPMVACKQELHVYQLDEPLCQMLQPRLYHPGHAARATPGWDLLGFVRLLELGGGFGVPALVRRGRRCWLVLSGCGGAATRCAGACSMWGPWEEFGNPCQGPIEADLAKHSQGAALALNPHAGGGCADLVFVADRVGGGHVWQPAVEAHGRLAILWRAGWHLDKPLQEPDMIVEPGGIPREEWHYSGQVTTADALVLHVVSPGSELLCMDGTGRVRARRRDSGEKQRWRLQHWACPLGDGSGGGGGDGARHSIWLGVPVFMMAQRQRRYLDGGADECVRAHYVSPGPEHQLVLELDVRKQGGSEAVLCVEQPVRPLRFGDRVRIRSLATQAHFAVSKEDGTVLKALIGDAAARRPDGFHVMPDA
eukprot:NODE_6120_length_1703_cov_12.944797.p1 GENE.NODE_6120_length_1703_cov_12.944797~~NODE_6120_length_1703_cov_12.944797.p1  ORF type:complete len:462 (-),score=117.33 NODE_6120_length_1703_cov_12.944797:316-1530(-)